METIDELLREVDGLPKLRTDISEVAGVEENELLSIVLTPDTIAYFDENYVEVIGACLKGRYPQAPSNRGMMFVINAAVARKELHIHQCNDGPVVRLKTEGGGSAARIETIDTIEKLRKLLKGLATPLV